MSSCSKEARTKGRIKRRIKVDRVFSASTYRKAKKYLIQDFEGRCAYSMQHYELVGLKVMDVDHYNCTLSGAPRNEYKNLYLSTRHCNGAKGAKWRLKDGHRELRLLDPCNEIDYGNLIFENPQTHKLEGTTPSAIWHIRILDLNAPHLVKEREDRAAFENLKAAAGVDLLAAVLQAAPEETKVLMNHFEKMIPAIPPTSISLS